jgi:hypothetical protein
MDVRQAFQESPLTALAADRSPLAACRLPLAARRSPLAENTHGRRLTTDDRVD